MPKFQPNKEAAAEKRGELQNTIQVGAKELLEELRQGKSERLKTLLSFSGKFYRYSPNNQFLIMLQCTMRGIDASYVASFTAWKQMNYTVRKGEKGIAILAPCPSRITHKNKETGEEEERQQLFFKIAYVFADTQVEAMRPDVPPIPTFFTSLPGDCNALCHRLEEVIREDGISIEEEKTAGQGYSAIGHIGIKPDLDSKNRFLTLVHEYAHELLHDQSKRQELKKRVKECHAEAVSYIVAHHFGIHNPYASDYLQSWGNDEKSLLAELETVQKAAATIISRMEKEGDLHTLTPEQAA